MKVIKTFELNDTYFTLPDYDGSHKGNVNAWMLAVSHIRHREPQLYKRLIERIIQFNDGQSGEMEIVSMLLQENFKYDVQVIWRKPEMTLQMFSLIPVNRTYHTVSSPSSWASGRACEDLTCM
ncbi:MAG: hypothetical protein NTY51_07265 [Deltaproteobacteria bacterium]|nr:hypothetical protein [Deltaproteobacteria bacterium]